MVKVRIKEILVIKGCILAVYYSPGKCYQFSIVDEVGEVIEFSEIFNTSEDGDEIASLLLGRLGSKFSEDLNSDFTISYGVSPLIEVSVGINVYRWTVWGSVIDRSKGCCFVTSDGDEFQLSSSTL